MQCAEKHEAQTAEYEAVCVVTDFLFQYCIFGIIRTAIQLHRFTESILSTIHF